MSELVEGPDPREGGDSIDKGLAAAFGEMKRAARHSSVLHVLQERARTRLGVHLDSHSPSDAPVRVTEEAKALRDPSGRYQMLGEIGRGGVGIVYKGRDQDLGRDVAMKVLKDEYASRADVLARFVEEAQIGGQLQHPGIVPVYELGLHAGERPYFAMKLVKGETLAAQLAKRSDASQERRRFLGIFEQICQTMAYAHARRVVHRDLKPANVMIGAFGEVQVVDWGFAKVLQRNAAEVAPAAPKHASERSVIETVRSRADSGSHSVVGSMLGTPAYMPPEQALGDIARVDERSDVFALGAILCEILTGDPPYRAEDGDLVRQAANAQLDGAHARLARCGADEALIALSRECLSAARRARPASAAELAERVSAFLTSVEDRAREAQVHAAEARLKHRVTLWCAAAGLLVLALGASGWIWIEQQSRARQNAATQRIASARSAASGAHGRAQAASLDLGLWSTAVASAEQLVALAQSDDVDAEARAGAESLLVSVRGEHRAAELEAARRRRDATMRERLESLRIPKDEDLRKDQTKELRRLDEEYGKAFREYLGGASLLEQPLEAALASLCDGDIEVELAASLDHWGLVRDAVHGGLGAPDPAGIARIRELAARLDAGDPWRSKLRALLPHASEQGASLRALVEEAELASLPAVSYRVLSTALWQAGEEEAAVTVLRRGQELHPQDFDICLYLGLSLELLEVPRAQEAFDAYRIAYSLRPEQNEVLHRQVMALYELGRFADAERLARLLLQREPGNPHWHYHLGSVLAVQLRWDETIECYQRALEIDPRDAFTHVHLARAFYALQRLEAAKASYQRAIEIEPGNAAFHCNLGTLLLGLGELEEAIASNRRSLEIDERNATAYCNLGGAFFKLGKWDESIAASRRALELQPDWMEPLFNLGGALAMNGERDEAIATYKRAIELAPQNAEIYGNLGKVLADAGDHQGAMTSYRRSLELDPKLANVHYLLGELLHVRGDLEEACASLRRALDLDPRHLVSINRLGAALLNLGRLVEAADCFRRTLELNPRFAPAFVNLGAALEGQHLYEEALPAYRRAEELFAEDPSPFGRQWLEMSRNRIASVEQRIALRANLNEVLEGRRAVSVEEWNEAVQSGYDQKRYREVLALTEATLRDAPELIGGIHGTYFPACVSALLAGSEKAPDLSAEERARLREQSRAWLTREVARWSTQVEERGVNAEDSRNSLKHAQVDPDLASVRGAAIEALPEGERAAWRELWKQVEAGAAK